jgi:hypothetical protein
MSDRSILDGPRTSRQEYQAERDAEARREIIEEFRAQGLWDELTEAERRDYVENTLREWRTPHPSEGVGERNPGFGTPGLIEEI